jgi:hypothetical protein
MDGKAVSDGLVEGNKDGMVEPLGKIEGNIDG